jgi:RND family efflux transporter MFP subunit
MDRKRALVLGGSGLAVATGLYLVFGGGGDDGKTQARAATVRTASLDRAAASVRDTVATEVAPPGLDNARPTDCLIEPSQVVRVNSGVEGVIQAVYVERGDTVSRGQVVAQLRADVDQAGAAAAQARADNVHTVNAAESRAAYLDAVRRRSEEISQYIARDAVEEAQANARAAAEERRAAAADQRVARLESIQSQRIMAEKTVRSPVSGIVVERAMAPGEYRGPDASHILTIAQVDPLYVEVFAPIAQLDSVSLGDEITIVPEEPVGGRYVARVKIIDRVFDAASGTFGMRLELPNPGYKLPAGLRCRIEFKPAARRS